MNVKFSKLRYSESDQNVELEWDEEKGLDVVHSSLRSPAAPEPELVATLRAFKPELLRILELPRPYGENLDVHQITISYRNERRGIVISARKKLGDANSPFTIHTPYLPEPDEGYANKGMSSQMVDLLNNLEKLAELYLDGHRAQQALALGSTSSNGKQEHQADIEDAPAVQLPKLGSKLKLIGDKRRTYRITKVSSERVTCESGTLPVQIARVDMLKWDDEQKVWLTEYLYDPDAAMTVHTKAEEGMPV